MICKDRHLYIESFRSHFTHIISTEATETKFSLWVITTPCYYMVKFSLEETRCSCEWEVGGCGGLGALESCRALGTNIAVSFCWSGRNAMGLVFVLSIKHVAFLQDMYKTCREQASTGSWS